MIGLDDVRERLREGVAAHGWEAVLHAVVAELYRDWESASEPPAAPTVAGARAAQLACVRAAAKCRSFPCEPHKDVGEAAMRAALELIDQGYADTRGIYTRDGLAVRVAAVVVRHLLSPEADR